MTNKFNFTSVSLTEREKNIVEKESKRRGINTFSAMLRVIINEWAAYKNITDYLLKEEELTVSK